MSKTNFLTTLEVSIPIAKAMNEANQIKAREFNVRSLKVLDTLDKMFQFHLEAEEGTHCHTIK